MRKKKMYNSENIYFGGLTFNDGLQGYYVAGLDPFEKVVGTDGEPTYKKLEGSTTLYKEFYNGTRDYLSISSLTPMTDVMPEEKRGQLVSKKMIYLYLIKHRMGLSKQNAKTKKHVRIEQFPNKWD